MKVAFCLYGLSGGFSERNGNNGYSHNDEIMIKSYESYLKHIINHNNNIDFDIYLHTWKHDNVEKILDMYKATKYIIDKKPIFDNKHYEGWQIAKLSRWISSSKVLSLLDNPEEYDYIFLCRFDVLFQKSINFEILGNNDVYMPNHYKKLTGKYMSMYLNYINKHKIMNNPNYKITDLNKWVLDWWFIIKPNILEVFINMGNDCHKFLNINIHNYIPQYLNKNNIHITDLGYIKSFDTPLARTHLYKKK